VEQTQREREKVTAGEGLDRIGREGNRYTIPYASTWPGSGDASSVSERPVQAPTGDRSGVRENSDRRANGERAGGGSGRR